jgi:hypothetical protein
VVQGVCFQGTLGAESWLNGDQEQGRDPLRSWGVGVANQSYLSSGCAGVSSRNNVNKKVGFAIQPCELGAVERTVSLQYAKSTKR